MTMSTITELASALIADDYFARDGELFTGTGYRVTGLLRHAGTYHLPQAVAVEVERLQAAEHPARRHREDLRGRVLHGAAVRNVRR